MEAERLAGHPQVRTQLSPHAACASTQVAPCQALPPTHGGYFSPHPLASSPRAVLSALVLLAEMLQVPSGDQLRLYYQP